MSITIISIAASLWFIFPAYCANAAPVIFGGGKPMDFGKMFFDGTSFLGSHKTWRGFVAGLIVGTLVGLVQTIIFEQILIDYSNQFQYSIFLGFLISLGALVGDLTESFIKRRLNQPPGSSLIIADQIDFIIGAFIFSIPVSALSLTSAITILLVTIPIHLLTNMGARMLNMKNKKKER